jgi:hypothetical protein
MNSKPQFTTEQIDLMFEYHTPTDETRPKYAAIREAHDRVTPEVERAFYLYDSEQLVSLACAERISDVLRRFAQAINEHAPDGADKAAAIRCVRLARNAYNEALFGFAEFGLGRVPLLRGPLVDQARQNLLAAKWQANAAIALHDARPAGGTS